MKNPLTEFAERAKKTWEGLNQGQRLLFLLISTLLVAGIVTLFLYAGKPDYAPLFQNLSVEEAGKVMDKLKELGIPYQLSSGGTRILVPQDKVYEARMKLAQEGLPSQGEGFEIFDKNTFGLTSFLQRVNYQRALQGELERTIMELKEVEGARVHLVVPEERLFAEEEKPPTASVVLKLRSGVTLQDAQIEAIANLIANSVEGLKPDRVAIIDDRGNILASGSGDESSWTSLSRLTATQLEVKKEVEATLTNRIQSMLESALGYNQAVVRVTADLDFEQREGQKETFEPIRGGEGIARSAQETEEKYQGGVTAPGGVPGVASNIPVYGQESEATGQTNDYTRRESTVNYEINRVMERFASSPGKVTRLSVAVLVDNNLPSEQVEKIEGVVKAAAGLNEERGDMLIVESLPFNREAQEEEKKALASQNMMKWIELLAKYGLIGILIFVMYSLGRRILVSVAVPEKVTAEFYEEPEMEYEEEKLPPIKPVELSPEEKVKMEVQKRMEEDIKKLVHTSPEDAVKLLRSWLHED
ncbi:MAG TPA: flagellar basal-body MS-ring/collar protein FliF [Candidatus Atribacteria bacterium]|nr:flagellar basal-body MS-ring/collar protein FliF [Candidatus Atribacteria bacterium]